MAKILIVEDDADILTMVAKGLSHEHFVVETATSGEEALELLREYHYEAIVLGHELPKISGPDLCAKLRSEGNTTPVLMLGRNNSLANKLMGFHAGVDDYLAGHFEPDELTARLKALLRRACRLAANSIEIGDLVIEPDKFRVTKAGAEVALARVEFALLEFLMRRPGQVFSPEALLSRVWTADVEASTDTVRTCIKRLRKKLGSKSYDSPIQNIHGVGYRLKIEQTLPASASSELAH